MTKRKPSNFGTGFIKGTFECIYCGHLTRETPHTSGTELCRTCYDFCMIENAHADGKISDEVYTMAAEAYKKAIERKGK